MRNLGHRGLFRGRRCNLRIGLDSRGARRSKKRKLVAQRALHFQSDLRLLRRSLRRRGHNIDRADASAHKL